MNEFLDATFGQFTTIYSEGLKTKHRSNRDRQTEKEGNKNVSLNAVKKENTNAGPGVRYTSGQYDKSVSIL
jgi:hypothetical protein